MRFQGAVIKEQGVTFAVVIVKQHVLDISSEANDAIASFRTSVPRYSLGLDGSGLKRHADLLRQARHRELHGRRADIVGSLA